jgi:hypothetical protein
VKFGDDRQTDGGDTVHEIRSIEIHADSRKVEVRRKVRVTGTCQHRIRSIRLSPNGRRMFLESRPKFRKVDQSTVGMALVPMLQTRPQSVEDSPSYGLPKYSVQGPQEDAGECRALTKFTEGRRGKSKKKLSSQLRVFCTFHDMGIGNRYSRND